MLDGINRIHLIGIGGSGMKAIANILIEKGFTISGSDVVKSAAVEKFEKKGAKIYIGHEAQNLGEAETVVISTAIPAYNPELIEAQNRGLTILHRSDIVKWIVDNSDGIAVAGAHGKTTTTSMLGQIFEEALCDPTIIIGGEVDYLQGNSKLGHGGTSIVEADESDGSFLKLRPKTIVITNIEDDHMDYYKTVDNLHKAFVQFITNLDEKNGLAVVCGDNEPIRDIISQLDRKFLVYGLGANCEYQARHIRYEQGLLTYDFWHNNAYVETLQLSVPGEHNVLNSLAACIVAMNHGIELETIKKALVKFKGAKRRFETKGYQNDVWVVDDYAHHPTEIAATLKAAKDIEKHRIVCVFQPHRYTRTQNLLDQFATAFKDADIVILTDIYSAGEAPLAGIDATSIPEAIKIATSKNAILVKNVDDVPAYVANIAQPKDLIITMGAGNINQYGTKILEAIKNNGN